MMASMPKSDEWILTDMDQDSQHYGRNFRFSFAYIASDVMKETFKVYIWRNYRTQNMRIKKLYEDQGCFRHFNQFIAGTDITSFKEVTNSTVTEFISYMKLKISDKTQKPLSHKYQKSCLDTLKAVIHWCRIHLPDRVPEKEIFVGNEYRGINKRLLIDFIPDDVLIKINNAASSEENCYVRHGIVILGLTGMRIGDMLALKVGCIRQHPISGYVMEWYDHKNRKSRPPLPVPLSCAKAVIALEEYTKEFREQADCEIKDFLFLHRPQRSGITDVITISQMSFGNWLRAFVRKHDIRDTDGELYRLTAHKFRRTLATDMLSKGTDIKIIQEVLGHSSATTAKKYYADVKDKEMAASIGKIGIIGNINKVDEKIIPDEADRQWFLLHKEKAARMCDGYCTSPISNGQMCERLLRRHKCYTCSRFITTVADLEAHRGHLSELEGLIEENIYGDHYAAHFIPIIMVLREIIHRLEEMEHAD